MTLFGDNPQENAQSIRLKNNLKNERVMIGQEQFWKCLEMQLFHSKNEGCFGKWTDYVSYTAYPRIPHLTTQLPKEDISDHILSLGLGAWASTSGMNP